jgi:hypothetical protein
MYYLGEGVLQNYSKSHMWMNIAGLSGVKNASKLREIIATDMTPTQIETAQRLARECVEKDYKGC